MTLLYNITLSNVASLKSNLQQYMWMSLLWKAQSIFGCSPQHNYWPRGSGGPFFVCSVCKHCKRQSENCSFHMNKKISSVTTRSDFTDVQPDCNVLSVIPAVVCSVRLDAAAFRTFVDHLAWFQLKAFYVFLRSIPFWHCSLVGNSTTQKIPSV